MRDKSTGEIKFERASFKKAETWWVVFWLMGPYAYAGLCVLSVMNVGFIAWDISGGYATQADLDNAGNLALIVLSPAIAYYCYDWWRDWRKAVKNHTAGKQN